MVSLVLVSHSNALAKAAVELAKGVNNNSSFPITYAGGTGYNHEQLGTDATEIMDAIISVYSDDGVLVLMDVGSAVISTKLAIDMLGENYPKVQMCPAPIVEGAVSAAVQILSGSTLDEICDEAMESLAAKQANLGLPTPSHYSKPIQTAPSGEPALYSFIMGLEHGLHTRPAAEMVNTLAPFKSTITATNVTKHTLPVNAKSLNKLALSNIVFGDTVQVTATGEDAAEAIAAIKLLAENRFLSRSVTISTDEIPAEQQSMVTLSPGIATGVIFHAHTSVKNIPPRFISDPAAEIKRFEEAVHETERAITLTKKRLEEQNLQQEAAIFDAHMMILKDSDVLTDIKTKIHRERLSPEYLYQQRMNRIAAEFRGMENEYMKERAVDVVDVTRQVLANLTGDIHIASCTEEKVILLAKEVTPSLISRWDKSQLQGVITEIGGISSHVAIIAKAMGIPAISGYKAPETDLTGTHALMDATMAEVIIDPTPTEIEKYKNLYGIWEASKLADVTDSQGPAVSVDGVQITILGNVGDYNTAQAAFKSGAEGIGLLRTEFMFLNRRLEPTEDEQVEALKGIIELFNGKPVTIRTLDIGGDKHLDWLPLQKEVNPFLGVRGIRLSMQKKRLFLKQLKSILLAACDHDDVRIMIPMVTIPEEVIFARKMLTIAHEVLTKEDKKHLWPVKLGIMVETPSAVLHADHLAPLSDFFSIGTNDLSQYIMCAERGGLAFEPALMDQHQPPVMKSIKLVVEAANKEGIELSVCGEMAGEAISSKILIALGVRVLSMNSPSIGRVKRTIRQSNIKELSDKVTTAIHADSPAQIRMVFE